MLCLHRGWTSADIARLSVYNLSHSLFLFIFNGHRDLFASEKIWFAVSLSMSQCGVWSVLTGSSDCRNSGRRDILTRAFQQPIVWFAFVFISGKLLSSGNILEPSNIISVFMPARKRSEWHKLIWKQITV